MAEGRMMRRVRSGFIRVVAGLVIVGCLVASPLSIWLAWGVLYPDVDGIGAAETFDAIVVLSGEDRRIERGLELAEDGRAPVLVAMYGEMWAGTRDQCRTNSLYETLCPVPPNDSTRGEAQLFGELAKRNDWTKVLVVTADYHLSRARILIERCAGKAVQVSYEAVNWDDVQEGVLRNEMIKTVHVTLIRRNC